MKIFNEYSKYYDLFYNDKDYKKESDYVNSNIKRFSKKTKNILSLGCGTGNYDFLLAKKGYNLTSIDSSKEAISIARKKQKQSKTVGKIKFNNSDIRTIKLNKSYDCALALFHVINYLNSNDDLHSCFSSVSSHLKKNGLFIFDCWYGPAVLSDLPKKKTKIVSDNENIITRKTIPLLHPNLNIAEIKFRFKLINKINKIERDFQEVHCMRYLFYPEVEMMLDHHSLKLIHSEEWMTGKPIGSNSWYVLFVAKKI